jgi:putative NADH-flavin reductase
MRVLVFGASGATGRLAVQCALDQRFEVTAFVRRPERLGALTKTASSTLRVVHGDVADADAVRRAVAGHDVVISTLGVSRPLHADPVVVTGVRHIVRAMEASGVRRLVYLSFLGVPESRAAAGPLLRYVARFPLRREIADHVEKETVIRGSSLAWTVVRPPKLRDGPAEGRYRAGTSIVSDRFFPQLSRADVASFLVTRATAPEYERQVVRLLS